MKSSKRDNYFFFLIQKEQLLDWLVLASGIALACLTVTWSYPYPGTISDSYTYLASAIGKNYLAYRPFGYSGFLQAIHLFSHSIYSIIVSQAFLYFISLGLLLLAIKRYWPPRHRGWFLLFELLVALSPTAIFLLDTILSDPLFCCTVFAMVAMVIVMIHEPSWVALVIYALAFFGALHTRYSALFFPLAFLPILLIARKGVFRWISVALTVLVIGVFAQQTARNMKYEAGRWQFSTGFDGWQLANNALHVIPFLDEEDLKKQPDDDMLVSIHDYCLDFRPAIRQATNDGKHTTAVFLWGNDYPLKQMTFAYMQAGRMPYYQAWIKLGSSYYKQYGKWVITHFPGKFIKYFLFPNTLHVFFPEDLEAVCGYTEVAANENVFVDWFDISRRTTLKARNNEYSRVFAPLLPWIEVVTWVVFLVSAVVLLVSRKWRGPLSRETRLSLWMLFLFGLIYYGSTTFSSPIVIRYWMPMHAVKLCFAWIAFRSAEKSVSLHS